MRKYSSNLHSLIGHPGECCAWFLALIVEPVNQLEKCQREQTEGSEISQEMSSNLTEEDGPSHEMKKKLWNSMSQLLWMENMIAQIYKTEVHRGLAQYTDTQIAWAGRSTRGRVTVNLISFDAFQMSVLGCCCRWDLRPESRQTWVWPWESLLHSGQCLRRDGWSWCEVSGEECCTSAMYYLAHVKAAFKREEWELTVGGSKVMSLVVSS